MNNIVNRIIRLIFNPEYRKRHYELKRLKSHRRYSPTTTMLLSHKLCIPDTASFLSAYKEIFEHEIYKFVSSSDSPIIIDCGANIGLSVIYFKQIYPGAKIIAFEPDVDIFNILQENLKSFNYTDVVCINKALWDEETELDFYQEGSDGGSLIEAIDGSVVKKIRTCLLSAYLKEDIDFLKVDIEGAEIRVLNEVKNLLGKVNYLFVEFHSFANKPQELSLLLDILKASKFRYYMYTLGLPSHSPFIDNKNFIDKEFLCNIFAYRN